MLLNILAVGDVVGPTGMDALARGLRPLLRREEIDFCVVNGENADGLGILPQQAEEIYSAGADVITLGNHSFSKGQIQGYLDENSYILRPANMAPSLPGRGLGVYETKGGLRLAVMNLMGRLNLNPHLRSPFEVADALLAKGEADLYLCDFHAETTSEKGALAYYLDGRVAALWGTHTHVPTADCRILPGGAGFVTDLGMCGAIDSVLGVVPEDSVNLFLGGLPRRYRGVEGKSKINAVRFVIDSETRRCVSVSRCDLT